MDLTPEEKRKIYEEEKAKIEAQEKRRKEKSILNMSPDEALKYLKGAKSEIKTNFKFNKEAVTIAVTLLIIIIALAVIFSSMLRDNSGKQKTAAKRIERESDKYRRKVMKYSQDHDISKLMEDGKNSGLVMETDKQMHKVMVSPYIWNSLTYEEKKDFASFFVIYFSYVNNEYDLQYAHILDGYTGKKIAKYDTWGFKVY